MRRVTPTLVFSLILSGLLVAGLENAGGLVEVDSVSREEGTRRIEAGDASALLVVPAGFGDAVLDDLNQHE